MKLFALGIAIASSMLLLIGLSKPWAMLWWRATQTRREILKLYGTIAAVGYFVYWLLTQLEI